MFLDWLNDPASFSADAYARIEELPIGARRGQSGLEPAAKKASSRRNTPIKQ
jgi:hypothetical protein